jgi:hypothetical protein
MRLGNVVLVAALLTAPLFVCAAEEKPAAKDQPAVKDQTKDQNGDQAWTGQLAAKPLDAKEGVAALMKVTKGDKVEWVNLLATGNNAKILDDWAVKRGSITVYGTLTAEGIKVSKVDESSEQGPVEKKKKKK